MWPRYYRRYRRNPGKTYSQLNREELDKLIKLCMDKSLTYNDIIRITGYKRSAVMRACRLAGGRRKKLSPEDKLKLVKMREDGYTIKELSDHFGIAQSGVSETYHYMKAAEGKPTKAYRRFRKRSPLQRQIDTFHEQKSRKLAKLSRLTGFRKPERMRKRRTLARRRRNPDRYLQQNPDPGLLYIGAFWHALENEELLDGDLVAGERYGVMAKGSPPMYIEFVPTSDIFKGQRIRIEVVRGKPKRRVHRPGARAYGPRPFDDPYFKVDLMYEEGPPHFGRWVKDVGIATIPWTGNMQQDLDLWRETMNNLLLGKCTCDSYSLWHRGHDAYCPAR